MSLPQKGRHYELPDMRPWRHGTWAGYQRHYRVGEKPSEMCQPCWLAGANYMRARRGTPLASDPSDAIDVISEILHAGVG